MALYIKKMQDGGIFRTNTDEYDSTALLRDFETEIANDIATHYKMQAVEGRRRKRRKIEEVNELNRMQAEEYRLAANIISQGLKDGSIQRVGADTFEGVGLDLNNIHIRRALNALNRAVSKLNAIEKIDFNTINFRDYFNNQLYGGNFTGSEEQLQAWLDLDQLDEATGKRARTNRINKFATLVENFGKEYNNDKYDFSKSRFKTREGFNQYINLVLGHLRDGEWNSEDLFDLSGLNIGIDDLNKFFADRIVKELDPNSFEYKYNEFKKVLDQDLKDGLIDRDLYEKKLAKFKDDYANSKYGEEMWDNRFLEFANSHWTGEGEESMVNLGDFQNQQIETIWNGNPDIDNPIRPWYEKPENDKYAQKLLENAVKGTYDENGSKDGLSNNDILSAYMSDLISKAPLNFTDVGSNKFYLNDTFDLNNGTVVMYDVNNHVFTRVHVDKHNTDVLKERLKQDYTKLNPMYNADKWKNGGKVRELAVLRNIQKALMGTSLRDLNKNNFDAQLQLAYADTAEKEYGDSSEESINRVKVGHGNAWATEKEIGEKTTENGVLKNMGLDNSSYLRIASLLQDLASVGASYGGVHGIAASGVLGLTSTATDLIADIGDDSVSSGEVWGNLLTNLGMAAAGLIPGGAGKLGKIWRTTKKLAPVILSAYGAISSATDPEIQKSFKKLASSGGFKDLNTNDWKNITRTLKAVVFTHNTGKAAAQGFHDTLKSSSLPGSGLLRKWGMAGTKSKYNPYNNGLGNLQETARTGGVPEQMSVKVKVNGEVKNINISGEEFAELNAKGHEVLSSTKDSAKAQKAVNDLFAEKHASEFPSGTTKGKAHILEISDAAKFGDKAQTLNTLDALIAEAKAASDNMATVRNDVNGTVVEQKVSLDHLNLLKSVVEGSTDTNFKTALQTKYGELYHTPDVVNTPELQNMEYTTKRWLNWFKKNGVKGSKVKEIKGKQDLFDNSEIGQENVLRKLRADQLAAKALGISYEEYINGAPNVHGLKGWAIRHLNTNYDIANGAGYFRGAGDAIVTNKAKDKYNSLRDGFLKEVEVTNSKGKPTKVNVIDLDNGLLEQLEFGIEFNDIKAGKSTISGETLNASNFENKPLVSSKELRKTFGPNWKSKLGIAEDESVAIFKNGKDYYVMRGNSEYAGQSALESKIGARIAANEKMEAKELLKAFDDIRNLDPSLSSLTNEQIVTHLSTIKGGEPLTNNEILYIAENKLGKKAGRSVNLLEEIEKDSELLKAFREAENEVNLARGSASVSNNALLIDENEIFDLNNQIKDLEQQKEEILKKYNGDLEAIKNGKEKASIDRYDAKIAEYTKRIDRITELAKRNLKSISGMDDASTVNNRIAQIKGEKKVLKNIDKRLIKLDKDITNYDKQVNTLTKEIKDPSTSRAAKIVKRAELKRVKAERAILLEEEKTLAGYKGNPTTLTDRITQLDNELSDLNIKLKRINQLEGRRTKAETLLKSLNRNKKTAITNRGKKQSIIDANIAALEKTKTRTVVKPQERITKQIETLRLQIDAVQSRINASTNPAEIAKYKSMLNALDDQFEQLTNGLPPYMRGRYSGFAKPSEGYGFGSGITVDRGTSVFKGETVKVFEAQDKMNAYDVSKIRDFALKTDAQFLSKADVNALNKVHGTSMSYAWKVGNEIYGYREGGKLEYLKTLRSNFSKDEENSSVSLSKLQNGGILKGETGLKALQVVEPQEYVDWYASLYPLSELELIEEMPLNLRSHFADGAEHNQNYNLAVAAKKNDAYVGNSGLVSDDLLRYYNSDYNNASLLDYVDSYNADAAKIRSTWSDNKHHKLNKQTGMSPHNDLFKKMFYNRTFTDGNHYIGWDENIKDIMGTSTWMRRMDRYKKEFTDLLNDPDTNWEEINRRVHKIKLGDGSEGYVYKKANGDIGIADERILSIINKQPSPTDPSPNPNPNKSVASALGWDENGVDPETSKKDRKFNPRFLSELAVEAHPIARLFANLDSNRKLVDILMQKRPALKGYLTGHMYDYGDFNALLNAEHAKAEMLSLAKRSALTSDANANAAMMLAGSKQGDDALIKGYAAYQLPIEATKQANLKLQRENYLQNKLVRDYNVAALVNSDAYKKDLLAGLRNAQMTNFNNYSMGQEKKALIREDERKTTQQKINLAAVLQAYKDAFENDKVYQDALTKYTASGSDADYMLLQERAKYLKKKLDPIASMLLYQLIHGVYMPDYSNYFAKALEKPSTESTNSADAWRSGGKVEVKNKVDNTNVKKRTEDLKELRRLVWNNIKASLHSLDNLSKSTLLHLQKMMG